MSGAKPASGHDLGRDRGVELVAAGPALPVPLLEAEIRFHTAGLHRGGVNRILEAFGQVHPPAPRTLVAVTTPECPAGR